MSAKRKFQRRHESTLTDRQGACLWCGATVMYREGDSTRIFHAAPACPGFEAWCRRNGSTESFAALAYEMPPMGKA